MHSKTEKNKIITKILELEEFKIKVATVPTVMVQWPLEYGTVATTVWKMGIVKTSTQPFTE